jgi:hypothetical protein
VICPLRAAADSTASASAVRRGLVCFMGSVCIGLV